MTKKKKKLIEKILMGAVIGGAIGSVVGASIKKKDQEPEKSKKKAFIRLIGLFLPKRKKDKNLKKIPTEK